MRVDGKSYSVDEPPAIDHRRKHRVEVVVDRSVVRRAHRGRASPTRSSRRSTWAAGVMHVAHVDDDERRAEVEGRALQPAPRLRATAAAASSRSTRTTSRSTARSAGARPARAWASSTGRTRRPLIRDGRRSLRAGGGRRLARLRRAARCSPGSLEAMAAARRLRLDTPFDELDGRHRRTILHGTGDDVVHRPAPANAARRSRSSTRASSRRSTRRRASASSTASGSSTSSTRSPAPPATASRLRDDAAAVRFRGSTLGQICGWPLGDTLDVLQGPEADEDEQRRSPASCSARSRSRLQVPRRRRARLPDARRGRRRRSPAARRSASAWRARSAAA